LTTYTANGVVTTPALSGLSEPTAVAVDAAGNIYVTNSGSNTLSTYTASGAQISPAIAGLTNPFGVAVR
jgi:YVTN family beta-propeller protein